MRFGSAMALARRICPTDRCFRVVGDISEAYWCVFLGCALPSDGTWSPAGSLGAAVQQLHGPDCLETAAMDSGSLADAQGADEVGNGGRRLLSLCMDGSLLVT